MGQCSNCYNGCAEIVSDQCVRYTGIDVPVLGIQSGDSLSFVEQALITFLTSTLDGTGIKPNIPEEIICELISQYLPTCGDITIVDVVTALIKGACDLQTQVTDNTDDIAAINVILAALNANYTIGCLTGVTASSDTHDIVQAIITKLCGFITQVDATYVKNADLCTLVQACISSESSLYSSKMIPYVAVPFFPTDAILANFNDGAGQGDWTKIYFCNGSNGTPDLRGRTVVGVTTGMGGGPLSPIVNPDGGLIPSYTKGSITGANGVALTSAQLAAHTHANTVNSVVIEPNSGQGHRHSVVTREPNTGGGSVGIGNAGTTGSANTNYATTGITVDTSIVNQSAGLGAQHSNVQPGMGVFYIMYIP